MSEFKRALREIFRYPSAIIGLITVVLFASFAIYVVFALPISQAIDLWRGGEEVWYQNPKYAAPVWFNYFSKEKRPISFVINNSIPR